MALPAARSNEETRLSFWTRVQALLRSHVVHRAKKSRGATIAGAGKAPAGRAASDRSKPAARRARAGHKAGTPRKAEKPAAPRKPAPASPSPEELLQRAMAASTPRARALWARRGLAARRRIHRTTQSMLLRQLYLAHYEARRFEKALEIAEQMRTLDVLPDVAHQDAARAAQALGDVEAAAGHLRLAARVGPAKRRAFHWWTLGSLYFLAGRHDEAISALTRAARWGTTDKPLYQGHLAVVRCARGEEVPELPALIDRLIEAPSGQGYGRFVLGCLAYYGHRWEDARRWLSAFVARSEGGRAALALSLEGEIALARATLAQIPPA
jgi:tetratricopeptide (TPR) repeat protein